MREMATSLAVIMLIAGVASVAGASGKAPVSTQELAAEIVSIDKEKMTLTFTTENGSKTAPVMKEAEPQLARLAPGDKVIITFKTSEKGDLAGIVRIRPDKQA